MGNFCPSKDAQLVQYFQNLLGKLPGYASTLGVAAGTITSLQNKSDVFNSDLELVETAKAGLKSVVNQKDADKQALTAALRALNNAVQLSPNATPAILSDLGLAVRGSTTTPFEPKQPQQLVANGRAIGGNVLSWKRNGNTNVVTFVVEYKVGPGGDWQFLDFTQKVKYIHEDAQPGVEVTYRVYARTDRKRSIPSNSAVVYPSGGEQQFDLKVA